MTDDSALPQWLLDAACGDEAFDAAYAGLPGERRAWIKKTAAQLFEMAGAGARRAGSVETCWTLGFQSVRRLAPLEGSLLLLDQGCLSAVRAAAVALPMVVSGAPAAAVCLDGDPAPDVLAALELCGLETVAVLDESGWSRLVEHLLKAHSQGSGYRLAVLALGGGPACEDAAALAFAAPCLKVWTPWTFATPGPDSGPGPDLGVWAGDDAQWDLETVAWAHAGHGAAVWNAADPGHLPQGMTAEQGDFNAFLSAGHRAVLVPASRLAEAEGAADLVLGPGQEGCWSWPGLEPRFFLRRRLCLSGGA